MKDNAYELQLRGEIEVKVNTLCHEIIFLCRKSYLRFVVTSWKPFIQIHKAHGYLWNFSIQNKNYLDGLSIVLLVFVILVNRTFKLVNLPLWRIGCHIQMSPFLSRLSFSCRVKAKWTRTGWLAIRTTACRTTVWFVTGIPTWPERRRQRRAVWSLWATWVQACNMACQTTSSYTGFCLLSVLWTTHCQPWIYIFCFGFLHSSSY